MRNGNYVLNDAGFIMLGDKIMGRASGYGPGTCWYQIAAKPYDEPSVGGFDSILIAFDHACAELERRKRAVSL